MIAIAFLIACAVAAPDSKAEPSVLTQLKQLNPQLGVADPLGLPMKLRSLRKSGYDFFRGTAELYYGWCKEHCTDWTSDPANTVLLHGDVHPGNIGTFRSPDETDPVHFSLVDLDEVFEGPFQLDLLRGAVSLRFAAREASLDPGEKKWRGWIEAMCGEYAEALTHGIDDSRLRAEYKTVQKLLDKAEQEDAADYFGKFIEISPKPRFRRVVTKKGETADLLDPIENSTRRAVSAALWGSFFSGDVGKSRRKIVGCNDAPGLDAAILDIAAWTRLGSSGSQGLRKYLILLKCPKTSNNGGFLMLQLKEEPTPAAIRATLAKPERSPSRGRTVAAAHDPLQCHPSDWIGSAEIDGRSFLIKPKSPFAKEPSQKDLNKPAELEAMARLLGALLGRGHAASIKNDSGQCRRLADAARALPADLTLRSSDAFEAFNTAYDALRRDSEFQELADSADRHVEACVRDATRNARED